MNSSLGPVLDRRNLGATGFGRTVLIKGCVLWQFKGSKRKPMGDQGEAKGEKAEGVHLEKWKSTPPQLEAQGPAKTGPQVGRAATTTSRWWSKASRTPRTRTPSPSTSAPAARRGETVRARAALTRARGWRAQTAGKLQVQRSFGGSKHGIPKLESSEDGICMFLHLAFCSFGLLLFIWRLRTWESAKWKTCGKD